MNEVGGRYAGIICGISNCIATIPGLVAPAICGVITSNVKKITCNLNYQSFVKICFFY